MTARALAPNATDLCMHCTACCPADELDEVGLCSECAGHVCGGCNTHVGALTLEQADDGVWLCRPCADAEYREQERAEDVECAALDLMEGWR